MDFHALLRFARSILTHLNDPTIVKGILNGLALLVAVYLVGLLAWKLPGWLSALFMRRPAMTWGNMLETGRVGEIADWFIWRFTLFGGAAIIFASAAAWIQGGYPLGVRVLGLSILFGAASTSSGWLLGLLFGVPRTLARGALGNGANPPHPQPQPPAGGPPGSGQQAGGPPPGGEPPPPPAGQSAGGAGGQAPPPGDHAQRVNASRANGVNTNLEDISDWLTKTIVGVGLTQLYSVPHFLWAKADQLNNAGFGWPNHGQLLALSLFVYFSTGGFWLGYVGTRTVLTALLNMVDNPAQQAPKDSRFEANDDTKTLEQFLKLPDKSWNAAHVAEFVAAAREVGAPDVSLTRFLNGLDFAPWRAQLVAKLKLPRQ
jgi:hypothetical protein